VPATDPAASRLSLNDVYRTYAATAWREARRLGVSQDLAEDIMQDVFLIVKRRLPSYDGGRASLAAWVRGITRRVVANHRRTRRRAEAREQASAAPGQFSSPEEALERKNAAVILRAFLGSLDEDKRTTFELCDIDGLSAPEVASRLGVSVNVVYSRLRRARERFERHVADLRMPAATASRRSAAR
jgi:RNA polymerase sigma-70 factor (ECF subfamily)